MLPTNSTIAIQETTELIQRLEAQLAAPDFVHIVTLINKRTGHEACLTIQTPTDRFCDVLTEIRIQRVLHGLTGYEIHEALPATLPF